MCANVQAAATKCTLAVLFFTMVIAIGNSRMSVLMVHCGEKCALLHLSVLDR